MCPYCKQYSNNSHKMANHFWSPFKNFTQKHGFFWFLLHLSGNVCDCQTSCKQFLWMLCKFSHYRLQKRSHIVKVGKVWDSRSTRNILNDELFGINTCSWAITSHAFTYTYPRTCMSNYIELVFHIVHCEFMFSGRISIFWQNTNDDISFKIK